MKTPRPEIFVSATTADLGSSRRIIKEALLTLGCTPVEQTNFPPAATTVRAMLREKISECDALVHVAGIVYGAEPTTRDDDEPRRSYTQMEFDIGRELGKPVYLFVCKNDYPFDVHSEEDAEKQALQESHRSALLAQDHVYAPVASPEELALRVHQLQARVEKLQSELQRSRRRIIVGAVLGSVLFLVLTAAVVGVFLRGEETAHLVSNVTTELDKQRTYITHVVAAYSQQQLELETLSLSAAERYERALAKVASEAGIEIASLKSHIDLFVAAIDQDPNADPFDVALSSFARQDFELAADRAADAADNARREREAAEALAQAATARAEDARDRERVARSLEGRSRFAAGDFDRAVNALVAAVELTPRDGIPLEWADLNNLLGIAANEVANRTIGAASREARDRARHAYEAVLEVVSRESEPQAWAIVQTNISVMLAEEALLAPAGRQLDRLRSVERILRDVLTIRTRQINPRGWAIANGNLGKVLFDQATFVDGDDAVKLLTSAEERFTASIDELADDETAIKEWAGIVHNRGLARTRLLRFVSPHERQGSMQGALADFDRVLDRIDHDEHAALWSKVQSSRGSSLLEKARVDGDILALDQSIEAFQAILAEHGDAPRNRDWAMIQSNLGVALGLKVNITKQQPPLLLNPAMDAMDQALAVLSRDDAPVQYAIIQRNLADCLAQVAVWVESAARRHEILDESIQLATEASATLDTLALDEESGISHGILAGALVLKGEFALRFDTELFDRHTAAAWLRDAEARYRTALDLLPVNHGAAQNFRIALQRITALRGEFSLQGD